MAELKWTASVLDFFVEYFVPRYTNRESNELFVLLPWHFSPHGVFGLQLVTTVCCCGTWIPSHHPDLLLPYVTATWRAANCLLFKRLKLLAKQSSCLRTVLNIMESYSFFFNINEIKYHRHDRVETISEIHYERKRWNIPVLCLRSLRFQVF
jgi:hypothetical protein